MTTLRERLGSGWAFPVSPEAATGHLAYRSGPEKVRDAIRLVLQTEPGERVMRPSFGCGLRQFLMQPNTVATRALIQREVQVAIERWEPRVTVKAVTAEPGDDPALVVVTVRYEHNLDKSDDVLVYPYSLAAA